MSFNINYYKIHTTARQPRRSLFESDGFDHHPFLTLRFGKSNKRWPISNDATSPHQSGSTSRSFSARKIA